MSVALHVKSKRWLSAPSHRQLEDHLKPMGLSPAPISVQETVVYWGEFLLAESQQAMVGVFVFTYLFLQLFNCKRQPLLACFRLSKEGTSGNYTIFG